MLSHIVPITFECQTFDYNGPVMLVESMSYPTRLHVQIYTEGWNRCNFQTEWIKCNIFEDHLIINRDIHNSTSFLKTFDILYKNILDEVFKLTVPYDDIISISDQNIKLMFSPYVKDILKNVKKIDNMLTVKFTWNFSITFQVDNWDKSSSSTPGKRTYSIGLYIMDLQIQEDKEDNKEEDKDDTIVIYI